MIRLIPYTDWPHNAHSVPFEQSNNAHSVPNLSGVLDNVNHHPRGRPSDPTCGHSWITAVRSTVSWLFCIYSFRRILSNLFLLVVVTFYLCQGK